jgi:hypothetical protein
MRQQEEQKHSGQTQHRHFRKLQLTPGPHMVKVMMVNWVGAEARAEPSAKNVGGTYWGCGARRRGVMELVLCFTKICRD